MPGKKEYEHGFCIGADTAEGLEQGDYDSAFASVALEGGHGQPVVFMVTFVSMSTQKNSQKLGCFITGRSLTSNGITTDMVILELVKLYKRLYHKDIFTRGYAELTDKIGWETTSMSKPSLIGQMGKWISGNEFECLDEKFWKETLTFVEDDGKMEAQGK